jgi:ankyrin repeat protein
MSSKWLHTVDEQCKTPLERAIRSNHMALTELLLRQEAEDGLTSYEGSSLLHKASALGLHEAVKRLMLDRADPNQLDKYGETPLHRAARHGHLETAKVLIEYGANVNAKNVFGLSPLHWVALNGHLPLAEVLMHAGADPNASDEYLDDLTPLTLASIMGYEELAECMESPI